MDGSLVWSRCYHWEELAILSLSPLCVTFFCLHICPLGAFLSSELENVPVMCLGVGLCCSIHAILICMFISFSSGTFPLLLFLALSLELPILGCWSCNFLIFPLFPPAYILSSSWKIPPLYSPLFLVSFYSWHQTLNRQLGFLILNMFLVRASCSCFEVAISSLVEA